jgi:hypothetical protein
MQLCCAAGKKHHVWGVQPKQAQQLLFNNSVLLLPPCQVSIAHQILHRRLSSLPQHFLLDAAGGGQLNGLAKLQPGTAPFTPLRHYGSSAAAGGGGGGGGPVDSPGSPSLEDSAENLTGAQMLTDGQKEIAMKAMQTIIAEGGGTLQQREAQDCVLGVLGGVQQGQEGSCRDAFWACLHSATSKLQNSQVYLHWVTIKLLFYQ